MYYVYVLKCKNGDYYKGCTANLRSRYRRHVEGQVPATANNRPVELIFYCAFVNKYKALNFEKYLKSGSGNAFMRKRFV
jgi:putative endonuclease